MKQEKWDKLHEELDNALNTVKKNKMKVEKKKAGRPRKVKEPVITVPNQAEIDLEYAERAIAAKNESIADLENRLDEAFKEQEAILNELKINLSTITFHCNHVHHNAGSITKEDVNYCTSLLKRIMKHKFESKPENC
jgi:exopolyphosphatase/pppGpp-phosphohydrolase